jgi:hypothetical protein
MGLVGLVGAVGAVKERRARAQIGLELTNEILV